MQPAALAAAAPTGNVWASKGSAHLIQAENQSLRLNGRIVQVDVSRDPAEQSKKPSKKSEETIFQVLVDA
jgi:hypothetical protein